MKVVRKEVFEFVVAFSEKEFERIREVSRLRGDDPEVVVKRIIECGFDKGTLT